jgi:PmbA protein
VLGREAALRALELARGRGLPAEAYYSMSRELEIRCFEGKVEHFEQAESGGLGLRVVSGGRAGLAYTEFLSEESVAETLDAAAEAVEHLSAQEGVELSDWPQPAEVGGLQAPEIEALSTERKIELALAAEEAARSAGSEIINVPWTGFAQTARETFLVNTEGLERSRQTGCAQMYVQALAARGQERKTYFDFCLARREEQLDPAKLGRTAAETAISMLGAEQPASGKMKVLFSPRPFCGLLGIFSAQFSGRNAEEKRTPLAGRLGEKIGAAGLELIDDALSEGAPASRPFDDEGVPGRRLPLVEDGVFRAFMHTAQTARRAGVEPTGHGVRGFRGSPSVAPSNLTIPAGKAPPEELRAGADVEIVSVIGGAGANQVSGEFSLPMLGFLLKDGRRSTPIHNFTVAGSFEGVLAGVEGIGSDFEFGSPGMSAAFGCGSVLVAGLSVAGRK